MLRVLLLELPLCFLLGLLIHARCIGRRTPVHVISLVLLLLWRLLHLASTERLEALELLEHHLLSTWYSIIVVVLTICWPELL